MAKAKTEPAKLKPAEFVMVPFKRIKRHKRFKNSRHMATNIPEMVATITNDQIQTPLIVWEVDGDTNLYLVSGFRRYAAVEHINGETPGAISEVPCRIFRGDIAEAAKLNLLENVQRDDLSPIEVCEYMAYLKELGHNQAAMAEILGKSPAWVSGAMTFMKKATEPLLRAVKDKIVSFSAALELASLEPAQQMRTVDELVKVYKAKGKKAAAEEGSKRGSAATGKTRAQKRSDIENQLEAYRTADTTSVTSEVKAYYYGLQTALAWVLDSALPAIGPFWRDVNHVDVKLRELAEEPTEE